MRVGKQTLDRNRGQSGAPARNHLGKGFPFVQLPSLNKIMSSFYLTFPAKMCPLFTPTQPYLRCQRIIREPTLRYADKRLNKCEHERLKSPSSMHEQRLKGERSKNCAAREEWKRVEEKTKTATEINRVGGMLKVIDRRYLRQDFRQSLRLLTLPKPNLRLCLPKETFG